MTFTSPFTAVTGAVITAAGWNTSGRDNLNHLRALLPDPGSSGIPLVSASTTTAAFGQLNTAGIADNAITEAKLDVIDSPADGEFLTYDSGTGRMEWTAPASVSGVPTGLIAYFATSVALAAATGWAAYSAADGRFIVSAGTVFSTTWTTDTNYGSAWSHLHHMQSHVHNLGGHIHGASALGVGGSISNNVDTEDGGSGADNVAADGHGHGHSLDVTGTTDGNSDNSGAPNNNNTETVSWTIPSRALIAAQKS